MIVHDVAQGSREWWALRLGIPTASKFSSIIQPSRLEPSKGRFGLIADLLVERILQKPSDFTEIDDEMVHGFDEHGTPWMRRGSDMEEEAAHWYAAHRASMGDPVEVTEVGFVTTDDGEAGGSPDRLVDEDGGLEIKCRSAKYHIRMVLGYDVIAEKTQVQGYLWLTGRRYWDALAYNPSLPKRLDRFHPDPVFFKAWNRAYEVFCKDLKRAEKMLAEIEHDVVEDSNLKALLSASIQQETTHPEKLSVDELEQMFEDMERAKALGFWGDEDQLGVARDITADDWPSVRSMWAYVRRLLESESLETS